MEDRYEEALERAKSAIKECGNNLGRIKMIESIFPELKESEDERIRKDIIFFLTRNTLLFGDDINKYKSWIAWLEKQGNMSKMCPRYVQEQKPQGSSIIEIINQGNAKVAADMVESKYKELTPSQVTKKSDKVEWSDEDQDFFGLLEGYLEFDYTLSMNDKANTLDWLKSIKERLQ